MPTDRLSIPLREWARYLPAATMFLAVLVFAVAEASLRLFPYYAQGFALSLLPLAMLPVCRLDLRLGGRSALWLTCLLAGLGYLALVQWLDPAPLMAWSKWTERLVAIAIAVTALCTLPRGDRFASVLGASAACALLVCGSVMWYRGDSGFFGMNNINYLVNTAGPACFAWSALLIHRGCTRGWRRLPRSHVVLAALGLGALLAIAVVLQRRGVQLAAVAALATAGMLWIGRRHPRSTWIAGIVLGSAALIALIGYVAGQDGAPAGRQVRFALWRAAWGTAMDGLPWGLGELGITRSQEFGHPWSRIYSAAHHWNFHAHNEFLDALINGGIIGLGLLLAQCAILAAHLRRIADRSLQVALCVLATTCLVHMMTSVCYGTAVGIVLWHLFGVAILLAPTTEGSSRYRLPPARWLALPLAAAAGLLGAWMSRNAFIHLHASMGVKYRTLTEISPPIGLMWILKPVSEEHLLKGELVIGDQRITSDEVTRRLHRIYGDAGPFIRLRFITVTKRYADALQTGREEEIVPRRAEFVALAQQLARVHPFDRRFFRKLSQALASDPELEAHLEPRLVARQRYHQLDPELPRPDLAARPTDLEGLADLYAHVYWSIVNEVPWEPISGALEHLVARVGHVKEIVATTVRAAAHAGVDPLFTWTIDATSILGRNTEGQLITDVLLDINTPWRARGVLPLIEALYPEVFRKLHAGQNVSSGRRSRFEEELLALRVYTLSRYPEEQPDPGHDGGPDDRSAPGSPPPPDPVAPPTPRPGSTPPPAP